ncbi:MAG: sugar ABC transporter permease [Acidobacteriota bacterium]|nr:sugar ABC transporter permease [Acidobacteriota bacterium]
MSLDSTLTARALGISRSRARSRAGIRNGRLAFLYLSPALLVFLVFTIGPALFVLYISFFNWNLLNPSLSRFVGGGNYAALLHSSDFWNSIVTSVYFVGATVGGSTVLGLGIALLLSQRGLVRRIVRLAVLTPYFTPLVATSIVWVWIFNPQFGLIDSVLKLLHLPEVGWLQSTTWAMPALIVYTLWHDLGFTVIIFLAGLATVSGELREAARVDGASYWHEVRDVVLPQLMNTTLFVIVITTIDSLQAFTQIYTMTGGGPLSATTTTGFLLYQQSFVFYKTGFGAAIAVVLFVVIALFTLAQLRLSRRAA